MRVIFGNLHAGEQRGIVDSGRNLAHASADSVRKLTVENDLCGEISPRGGPLSHDEVEGKLPARLDQRAVDRRRRERDIVLALLRRTAVRRVKFSPERKFRAARSERQPLRLRFRRSEHSGKSDDGQNRHHEKQDDVVEPSAHTYLPLASMRKSPVFMRTPRFSSAGMRNPRRGNINIKSAG